MTILFPVSVVTVAADLAHRSCTKEEPTPQRGQTGVIAAVRREKPKNNQRILKIPDVAPLKRRQHLRSWEDTKAPKGQFCCCFAILPCKDVYVV